MRRNFKATIIVLIAMLLFPLYVTAQLYASQDYRHIYNSALQDAMLAEEEEISDSLVPIDPNNKNLFWRDGRVLVVTWTRYPKSYPAGNKITTQWGDTWVTAVPELKSFVKKNKLSGENILRIEQLLGLPPGSGNMWFAELWVKPEDLFRPGPDPEINDTTAELRLKDSAPEDHKKWFNNTIMSLYFGEKNYPWTRLGYTYDWGNPQSEIGLSEFIIKKGSSVIVNSVHSNEDYIKLAKEGISYSTAPENKTAERLLERRQLLDAVFQVSTINALLQGVYDGEITCRELKNQGDFGIGTFDGLDGEMVLLDNDIYQVKADGSVISPQNNVTSPFATVTFFDTDYKQEVADIGSNTSLQQIMDKTISNKNLIYAIRLDGTFKYVKTRSVPGQVKPYPPLAEITKNQPVFEFDNIKGTLVGFWFPQYIQGINAAGYHLHFISEDRKFGGHLLDCSIDDGLLQVDLSGDFHMMLPQGEAFRNAELSTDRRKELEKAEN